MNAADLLFPRPRSVRNVKKPVVLPERIALAGVPLPAWLTKTLATSLRRAGVRLLKDAERLVELTVDEGAFGTVAEADLRAQSYQLILAPDGAVRITAPSTDGLRHGVMTLCQLLDAAGAGATLNALTITDTPAYRMRGIQIDLAREYYPPVAFLQKIMDHLASLKMNTLWLYIENHFRAPGMEDISPKAGLTPAQARALSAYGAARGIDVVPGTNVLSHMEGWFRLERHADFCDGRGRSYPVLTRPEPLAMVKQYLDALMDAFPSPNIHAGLDELLFTGMNPEAKRAVERKGKALYYGDFARKVVKHIQRRGKTCWIWDDMLTGKNIHRVEGFGKDVQKALACIPEGVVFTHWWYWGPEHGHPKLIRNIATSGRPWVVAPSCRTFPFDCGHFGAAARNEHYMGRAGIRHGAFGYVCTHWESDRGNSFAGTWPLLAMSAAHAWRGGETVDDRFKRAWSFTMTGDTVGALAELWKALDAFGDLMQQRGVATNAWRCHIIEDGPPLFWRRVRASLTKADLKTIAGLATEAKAALKRLGRRNPDLRQALPIHVTLLTQGLAILKSFDAAWDAWHAAALIERTPGRRKRFLKLVADTKRHVARAIAAATRCRDACRAHEAFGHTPYDAIALDRHAAAMGGINALIDQVVDDDNGLPYFEKLLDLPDGYHASSIEHLRWQSRFHGHRHALPWLART